MKEDYEYGCQNHTNITDVYLYNDRLYQTRKKFDISRKVSFPVSKSKLAELGFPKGIIVKLI